MLDLVFEQHKKRLYRQIVIKRFSYKKKRIDGRGLLTVGVRERKIATATVENLAVPIFKYLKKDKIEFKVQNFSLYFD
jgi:hypothetical protein